MTDTDTAVKLLDAVVGGPEDLRALAIALDVVAARRGYVITMETKAEPPLAMGRYGIVVDVRPARLAQQMHAQKTLEDNDAMVGRRRRFSSHGKCV
jgi:hypothetical protein